MADIKEKIRKLLALAGNNPSEHEAKAALIKARELMAKNKLSENDFKEGDSLELTFVLCEEVSWTTDSGRIWMANLCKIMCDKYCCSAAWRTPPGTRTYMLVITGIGSDVEVCREVVRYAVEFVEGSINKLQRKYRRQDPKTIANSYAMGFISGLEMAFEEQEEEHPDWALAVIKPGAVMDYENNLKTKSVKTKSTPIDPASYMHGQVDGMKYGHRKRLSQEA